MQVSESPAAAPLPGTGAKDGARPPGDQAEAGASSDSGQRFRRALERKRRDPPPVPNDAASAAALAGWFRAESGATPGARAAGVAGPSAARAVDRVLIGSGPDGAQARIRIGAGALAGTEIQLWGGAAGHAVEARLLTHTASSRQTLSVVMDEIRLRLRDRGIALSRRVPVARATASLGSGDESAWGARGPAGNGSAGSGR